MKYNPTKHHRRSIRLKGYDYASPGAYFVTICVQNRECILGEVTDGEIQLNTYGRTVDEFWRQVPIHFTNVSVDAHITMPNHIAGYHGWERLRVWTGGVELGELEMWLDGELITRCDAPPYLLGTEEYESDGVIPPGSRELLVRARDGDGWLEQTFSITGAG